MEPNAPKLRKEQLRGPVQKHLCISAEAKKLTGKISTMCKCNNQKPGQNLSNYVQNCNIDNSKYAKCYVTLWKFW